MDVEKRVVEERVVPDNDVSSTALTVLQGLLYTGRKPAYAHLVSEEAMAASECLLSHSEAGCKRLKQLQSPLFRALVPWVERLMIPGLTLHYALRKQCIEDHARAAISQGVTQVVNLGAGFDTLALRLAQEFPDVCFIEVDQPATQQYKADALQAQQSRCHLLPVDFATQSLEQQLAQADVYTAEKPTLFIAEGVLMYLSEPDVKALFTGLKRLSGDRMEVIFTYLDPSQHKANGPVLSWYLRLKKEPLHWRVGRTELGDFLAAMDYRLDDVIDTPEFKRRYFSGQDVTLQRGEAVAVAR